MHGDTMTFRIKTSLLGIAAVSLIAPVASHAQLAGKGPWINDSSNNAVRDGRGSTCVSAGGSDHAFDNAYCSGAAADAKATTEAEAAARKAAAAEQAAAAQAASEAALLAVQPGSGLKPGQKGFYVRDSAGNSVRDGAGASCVRDSRWSVAFASEECDPELFELWRKRQGAAATGELAPRLKAEPPLRETSADALDRAPGAAPAAAPAAKATAPLTGDNTNLFPITTYDGGEALAQADDGIPDDDRVMPGDEPEDEARAEDADEDEDTVALADTDAAPAKAAALDTSPGVAPAAAAPAAAAAAPATGDNTEKFPVTTYTVEKEPAKAQPPAKPTSLPVTVRTDGLFAFDRSDLRSELVVKLDGVVDMLNGAKYDRISVVGYTDPIGSAAYNQKLSERRAEAVKKYLVNKGIDPARVVTSGKGESNLVVTRADCKGKRKKALVACLEPNRRVVIDAAGEKPAK
jgi:outer membrane protein OmpA-like peptidoglycan-associated protein